VAALSTVGGTGRGRVVVFLGPSLDLATARALLDADYRPPVARGDVAALLAEAQPPSVIGVVDGRFMHTFAISPKEILAALDRGIAVYGAASMGALRAAELGPYGMVGVGRIWAAYATGEIDADDEVALLYDEQTGAALTDPLITMRYAVEAAVRDGAATPAVAELFVTTARQMWYPHRRTREVLSAIRSRCQPDEHAALADYLANRAPDAKRDDAIALLRTVAERIMRG
jgi:hypothetical protein